MHTAIKAKGKEAARVFRYLKAYLPLSQVQKVSKSAKSQPDIDSILSMLEDISIKVATVKGMTPSLKVVVKEGQEVLLYSKDKTKVLGRFPFGEGNKYKNERTAREAAATRERQIQFFKRQKGSSQLILTLKELMVIDENLGQAMASAGVKRFSVNSLPTHLAKGLRDKMKENNG